MEQINIQTLRPVEIQEAAKVAARALAPTPFEMAISRRQENSERALEAHFRYKFGRLPGQVFVVKKDNRVIGVMRIVEWPCCQMTRGQALRILPTMLLALRGSAIRELRGRSVWAKHDPKEPHWHLDPLTVLPEMQRQGIGSHLLKHFCEHVDAVKQAAYLETDRPETVRLYKRFGFSVTGEASALGMCIYFMWRTPR